MIHIGQVPKGRQFLPKYNVIELAVLHRMEENSKARLRLHAALLRREGMTLQEISKKLEYPLTTVGDWLRRMHREGISRRYSIKQSGGPRRLTKKQEAELNLVLSNSSQEVNSPFVIWTTILVCIFIKQQYGVSYKIRQTRNLLHRLGFSCKKPSPARIKADKKIQSHLKKDFEKTSGNALMIDKRSLFWTKVQKKERTHHSISNMHPNVRYTSKQTFLDDFIRIRSQQLILTDFINGKECQ